jgi:hypothetical protein
VGEPRRCFRGEHSLPLTLQNFHRYFLYIALPFLVILASDAWRSFWFDGHFGVRVGSLVLVVNVVLLASYTLGCHSLRHLTGGLLDALSPARKKVYNCVSSMNTRHMLFAWLSLFWVAFSDLYVRMCSMGIWTDGRIF